MTSIYDIKKSALALGACNKVESINSIEDAIALLMTPQGREFALKTGFPAYYTWRDLWDSLDEYSDPIINNTHLFVDTVKTELMTGKDCIVVGISKVKINAYGPKRIIHVIAMYGADVEINASNYAVVTVTSINATVKITNDGTAIVTVEQSEKGGSNE